MKKSRKSIIIITSAVLSVSIVILIILGAVLGSRKKAEKSIDNIPETSPERVPENVSSEVPGTVPESEPLSAYANFFKVQKNLFLWNIDKSIEALWSPKLNSKDMFNFYKQWSFQGAVVYAGCAEWNGASYAQGEFPYGNFSESLKLYEEHGVNLDVLIYLNDDYNDLSSNRNEMIEIVRYFENHKSSSLRAIVVDMEPQNLDEASQLQLFVDLYAEMVKAAPSLKIIPTIKNAWTDCEKQTCILQELINVGIREFYLMAYSSDPQLVISMANRARKFANNVYILIETDDISNDKVSFHHTISTNKTQFYVDYQEMTDVLGPVSIHSYSGFLKLSDK